jgi:hypothetical protein
MSSIPIKRAILTCDLAGWKELLRPHVLLPMLRYSSQELQQHVDVDIDEGKNCRTQQKRRKPYRTLIIIYTLVTLPTKA